MSRRFTAIVNPLSGRGGVLPLLRNVAAELAGHDAELDIRLTERAGHATQLAAQEKRFADALLVAGGDGTVREVIDGIVGSRTPLVILRGGTENLLARQLGMPRSADVIAQTLVGGVKKRIDAYEFNDRRFVSVAGVGFDAECVLRMSLHRNGHITHRDYFWPIWRTFWVHRFPRIQVETESGLIFDGRGMVFWGGIRRYSVGLRLLKHAVPDDGLLDVCAMACRTRRRLVLHAIRVMQGRHIGGRQIVYQRCREVRISSPDQPPIQVDGDIVPYHPIRCRVLPQSVTLLVPAARNDVDGRCGGHGEGDVDHA